jgi:hypothetical protein
MYWLFVEKEKIANYIAYSRATNWSIPSGKL